MLSVASEINQALENFFSVRDFNDSGGGRRVRIPAVGNCIFLIIDDKNLTSPQEGEGGNLIAQHSCITFFFFLFLEKSICIVKKFELVFDEFIRFRRL